MCIEQFHDTQCTLSSNNNNNYNNNNNNKTCNAHVSTLLGVQGAVKTNNKQNKTKERKTVTRT